MEAINAGQHSVQVKQGKRGVGIDRFLVCVLAAKIEEGKILVNSLQVVASHGERSIAEAGAMKHHCFKHSPNAAIAIPKRMDQLKIVMYQGRANQGRYFHGGQFTMPCNQMIEQKLDVAPLLRRLIAAAMRRIAYVGHDAFWVVSYLAGPIVFVGNAIGNRGMDLFDKIDGQAPVRCLR